MRTQEEIIQRFKDADSEDMFGFESGEYCRAMTVDALKSLQPEFINPDADLSEIAPDLINEEAIRSVCVDYMSFAWDKANNFRGISAYRSLMHYKAWLWLLGTDQFDNIASSYEYYGKDQLVEICQFLGIDSAQWDDGVRLNEEPY